MAFVRNLLQRKKYDAGLSLFLLTEHAIGIEGRDQGQGSGDAGKRARVGIFEIKNA